MNVGETRHGLGSHLLEERALIGGDWLAAPALQRQLRVVRDAVDADLEVEVRASRPSRHADVADGRSHCNTSSGTHTGSEIPHMAVAAHHAVAVPDVDHVAVATFDPSEDYNSVADRADGCPHRRCVIRSGVIAPLPKERMLAQTEDAADTAESHRRAKERCPQRESARVIILSVAGTGACYCRRAVKVNRLERVVAVGKTESGAEDLVDDDRAIGLLQPLDEDVKLVPLHQVAAHVDLVLEDVGE